MNRANALKTFFCSTIGKKCLVALTGLALSGFVLTHMSGNLLMFVSAEAYNRYGHGLISNPAIELAEIGLALCFITHVLFAALLNIGNKSAVGANKNCTHTEKSARFASRYMVLTGLLVLVFVVLHLITFKYGTYYPVNYNGIEMRDLYRLLTEEFQNPLYVGGYVFAMIILGLHLAHGFSGAFQSLGLSSVRCCVLKKAGYLFAAVVAGGFMIQPIYIFLKGGN